MRCAAATNPDDPAPVRRVGRTVSPLAAALILVAPAVQSGPWAREEGGVFLSFGITGEETRTALMTGILEPEGTVSAYAEYGLGHRLTAGLDLNWAEFSEMTVVFVRRTLTPPDATWQAALDAGAGMRRVEGQPSHGLVRLGASIGRGFGALDVSLGAMQFGHGGGWLTLDASALLDTEGDDVIWQSELTIGMNIGARARGILALKAEEWPGSEPLLTARPSVVLSLTERTSVQAGGHLGLDGSDAVGFSLSLWQEF